MSIVTSRRCFSVRCLCQGLGGVSPFLSMSAPRRVAGALCLPCVGFDQFPEVDVGADSEAAAVEVDVSVGVDVVVPVDESLGNGVDVEAVCPLP